MKRRLIALLTAVALGTPATVGACGACDEDKVAATYDHAVVEAAIAKGELIVFVAVDGPVSIEALPARIAAAARTVRGVRKGTVRIATSPPAFSFALDAREKPEVALTSFRQSFTDRNARLSLLRVMRDGKLAESN